MPPPLLHLHCCHYHFQHLASPVTPSISSFLFALSTKPTNTQIVILIVKSQTFFSLCQISRNRVYTCCLHIPNLKIIEAGPAKGTDNILVANCFCPLTYFTFMQHQTLIIPSFFNTFSFYYFSVFSVFIAYAGSLPLPIPTFRF